MTTSIENMVNEAINGIIRKEAENLLEEYNYPYSDHGLQVLFSTYAENKKKLISLFSKHPNWNPERLYISFSADLHRNCDMESAKVFFDWILKENTKKASENNAVCEGRTYDEWYNIWWNNQKNEEGKHAIECMRKIDKENAKFVDFHYHSCLTYFLSPEMNDKISAFEDFIKYVEKRVNSSSVLTNTEEFNDAEYINNLFGFLKKENGNPLLRVQNGQKWSRVVNKVCTIYGYNKIVDMQTSEWYTDGVYHSRTQDKGYNYQFAAFADSINPFTITRHTVLSLNPIDYWTMSFGTNWASCHTIDKNNTRGSSNSYSGCYSSGTESYMLDESSFIMYTVTPDFDETRGLENADKERRCVFFYGEDKLIQSRVYPDGRDGGDASIAGDFRSIAQKVIAECLNAPNLWMLERKTASHYIDTAYGSTHYTDYTHYSDNTVSFLKRSENDNEKNVKMIPVGHEPICPNCGNTHTYEENILCPVCCDEGVVCAECGAVVNMEDAIYDEDTERYYCDSDCARRDGCYYCENVDEFHSDHVYYDDYYNDYFYDRDEEHITTADGSVFMDSYNAENAGYIWVDIENDWYHEDKVEYCEHCGEYVLRENYNYEKEMCDDCAETEEGEE
jgi:hypothetical protein